MTGRALTLASHPSHTFPPSPLKQVIGLFIEVAGSENGKIGPQKSSGNKKYSGVHEQDFSSEMLPVPPALIQSVYVITLLPSGSHS
jgi:hypothetical protein